jgi:pimeloyl-ACP methyl ester carboxylesterase
MRCDYATAMANEPLEPSARSIPGAHGVAINLLEWSSEGVPLLFLHGFGNEAHIWDDYAPEVAGSYRTLALDHRGHGDSGWDPEGRYGHGDMVADVEAVTDALGIDRLVIIGHSLGGRIATLFCGRHPERIAGFVIVDIGPEIDARGTTRIRQDVEGSQKPSFASVEEYANVLSLAYPAAKPHAVTRMARNGLREGDDGRLELKMDPALRGIMQEGREEAEIERDVASPEAQWEALAKITCPTLVVRGAASDILTPETADKMADDVLPNGQLAVVAQAGHSVMTDNPDGFRDAVNAFVLA